MKGPDSGAAERTLPYRMLREALESTMVRQVAETFTTRILLLALGLVTTVMIARALGPEGRGLYAVAVTLSGLGIQFGNLGLPSSNTYLVARRRELLPTLVSNSLLVSLAVGGAGALALWALFNARPGIVRLDGPLLAMALLWIPFGLALLLLQNLLLAVQDVRSYNLVDIGNRVLSLLLVGLVILAGAIRVETVFLAVFAALLASTLWAMARLPVGVLRLPRPSWDLFRGALRYSTKAYFAGIFGFLVHRFDMLLLQNFRGPVETGYYSVAVALADLIYILPMVTGGILFPRLAAIPDGRRRWLLARRAALWVGVAVSLPAAFLAAAGALPVRILYGASFLPAVSALAWLMPGILCFSVNTILMNYFAAIGMPPVTVWSPAAAAAVNVLLNFALMPSHGAVGAALASSITYALMLSFSLVVLARGREAREQ